MRVKKYGLWLRRRDADPAGSLPSAEARAATQVAEHRDRPKAAPSSSFGDSPRVHTPSARCLGPASRELPGRARSVRPAMRCQGSGHTSRQHGTDPKRRPRRRVRPSLPPPRLSFCGDPPRLPFRGAIRTLTWELWESRRRPVCHPRGWNNPVTLPTRRWVPPTPPGCFRPGGGAAPTAASRRVRRAPLAPVPPMGPGRFPSSRALNDATAEAGTGSDHTA